MRFTVEAQKKWLGTEMCAVKDEMVRCLRSPSSSTDIISQHHNTRHICFLLNCLWSTSITAFCKVEICPSPDVLNSSISLFSYPLVSVWLLHTHWLLHQLLDLRGTWFFDSHFSFVFFTFVFFNFYFIL